MRLRARATGFAWFVASALFVVALGLGVRAWAATRFFQYYTCNFDKAVGVDPQPSGLGTINVDPKKGALVHCPIVSDDAIPHAGSNAEITVFGHDQGPLAEVSAIACVTFASSNGFFCTKPKASGTAFTGEYAITFKGPFAKKYAKDFPFVDVTLNMANEGNTTSLRGITLSGP